LLPHGKPHHLPFYPRWEDFPADADSTRMNGMQNDREAPKRMRIHIHRRKIMTKRRGHGEGGIYQRESDGKWCASVDLGFVNGKR
jgi:hypothetical protein